MGNMFCGYACVVYAMRGEYETAAPFIGFAIVLDMLDGRIARLTGTDQRVRRRVRFAGRRHLVRHRAGDPVVRVGAAAARPPRAGPPGSCSSRAAAMRLARFNIQSGGRRRQALLRRHAEPGGGRRFPPRPCSRIRTGCYDYRAALPALAMVLVPAVLMVSTIRFRSFKTIDLQTRRPYTVLILIAPASWPSRRTPGSCSS